MHLKRAFCFSKILVALALFAIIAPNLVTSGAKASQISYIRDTEIENAIRYYSQAIFDAAGLDAASIKIHIINDNRLNAFVAEGQQIFMNTGTLVTAEKPEEVIGVIAHEVGHITGGHLSQLRNNIESAQDISLASTLLGIPLAVLSGQPEIAIAALGLGSQVASRSFLKFTRQNEEAADQAALEYLDRAQMSSKGMVKFLERVYEQSKLYSVNQNPYSQTHPLPRERISFVKNHASLSRYSDQLLDPSFYIVHDRIRAKLIGYLEDYKKVLQTYPESDTSVPAIYARSIAHLKRGEFDKALILAERLLKLLPNDPFFIELKADIYRDSGKYEEAITTYKEALEILPWASLLYQALGRSQLETQDPDETQNAIQNLKKASDLEPEVSFNWRLLATAYGRIGDQGNTALALAEESLLRNQLEAARGHAERALDILPRGSAGWLRAEDISIQSGELEEKIK